MRSTRPKPSNTSRKPRLAPARRDAHTARAAVPPSPRHPVSAESLVHAVQDALRTSAVPPLAALSSALPQLLRQTGIDTLHLEPGTLAPSFPHTHFLWQGIDGTQIPVHCGNAERGAPRPEVLPLWTGEVPVIEPPALAPAESPSGAAAAHTAALLHDAEFFAALRPGGLADYPAAALDQAWRDLASPSSARRRAARRAATALAARARSAWARQINTRGIRHPLAVFNTLSWAESDLVTIPLARGRAPAALRDGDGNLVSAVQHVQTAAGPACLVRPTNVPALGYAIFDLTTTQPAYHPAEAVCTSCSPGGAVLENRLLRLEIDAAGRISRLFDKTVGREVLILGRPANQFILADVPLSVPGHLRLIERGPLRATLEIRHTLGRKCRLTQRIVLGTESRRVDFQAAVEGLAPAAALRVEHPVAVLSSRATYEIPFGHIERPTHRNAGVYFQPAAFSSRWADLSESGYGMALLQDGDCTVEVQGQSLALQCSASRVAPSQRPGRDASAADDARHTLTYSLHPHPGDFAEAGVLQQAFRLAHPLYAQREPPHPGPSHPRMQMLGASAPNVLIESVRKARRGSALIVRLREAWGRRGPLTLTLWAPVKKCTPVDLIERPGARDDADIESRTIRWRVTPHAIRTLKLELQARRGGGSPGGGRRQMRPGRSPPVFNDAKVSR